MVIEIVETFPFFPSAPNLHTGYRCLHGRKKHRKFDSKRYSKYVYVKANFRIRNKNSFVSRIKGVFIINKQNTFKSALKHRFVFPASDGDLGLSLA